MKGSPVVIDALQKAAAMEAALVTLYHLDKVTLKFMRLKGIAKDLSEFGEDAECYLNKINKRLYFLGTSPAYPAGSASALTTVTDIFERELAAEIAAVTAYNDFAITCMNEKDDNTRNLFEHLVKFHEDEKNGHINWLEGQLGSIKSIGEPAYLTIALKV